MIRFIGDVHGKFNRYRSMIKNSPHPTIQVGDFGVGFRNRNGKYTEQPDDKLTELMSSGGHTYIRGNHDNPDWCKGDPLCILDGATHGNMMFVGGAVSIDKPYRIEGQSWWPEEELTKAELDAIVETYSQVKPQIMVTHECPERVAVQIVQSLSMRSHPVKLEEKWASRSRAAFERMMEIHQPRIWIHGHWHVRKDWVIDGTRFLCLPELGTADVQTDSFFVGYEDGYPII